MESRLGDRNGILFWIWYLGLCEDPWYAVFGFL